MSETHDEPKVPKLRFPEFEGEWRGRSIGDFGRFYYGKSAPKHSLVDEGGTPCVRYGELYSKFTEVIDRTYSRTSVDPSGLRFSKGGEVLVPRVGEDPLDFSQCAYLPLAGVAIGEMISVFDTKENGEFVSYLFNAKMKKPFARMVEGASVSNLYYAYLEPITTHIPCCAEQEKIVDFVRSLNKKRKLLERRREALNAYKKAIMQQLFSQELRFTREGGSAFPDWEEKQLGDLFDWVATNSLSRAMLGDDRTDLQNIHYGDIHSRFSARFKQSDEDVPYVQAVAAFQPSEEAYCRRGDLIIADASEDYADIGKSIEIIEVEPNSLVAGLHTYIARPKNGKLALGFAGYLFQTWPLRKQIMRIAQGISVLGISKTNLAKLSVQLPHPDEQRKIAEFLGAIDDKIDEATNQIEAMQYFKKALLQQMFV